ncbi:MAG TPA: TraR/DksA C4-type zinc finger protein [Candidatus Limnocylindrales bacterium]|nr:TraR/DksA C4-type zinc finger protein [Candidatus Limnocylindrales bacterium]
MAQPAIDLKAARKALEAERARLLAELGEPIEAPGQMTYGSQAAAATFVFEQQRDLALRDRSRLDLHKVESALRALDDGTYGTCVTCGNSIAPERLEAIPWVAQCIDCARKAAATR